LKKEKKDDRLSKKTKDIMEKDLLGKVALVIGIGDDQGFGFAIAKKLAERGATILIGTWAPVVSLFTKSWKLGKFDASRTFSDGSLMEIQKVYPIDAVFDRPEDIPEDIKNNKRYKDLKSYTISEMAELVKKDVGQIDYLVHSLANGPEVTKPLLETSRKGYLAAVSSSSYSFVSIVQHFAPIIKEKGSVLNLTYIASQRAIPRYGGGMSSAKAALESDTRTLAFEAGRKYKIRINSISAGALRSRAAKAIGMIDDMIEYSLHNAPIQEELQAEEVGKAAYFLLSDLASAITGVTLYVDKGLHAMGVAVDSPCLQAKA
jgi:enoyl-[acyl-carrier protein] reductase I